MGAILEAYVTNLGKYAEGQLVGETLKFPTTMEEVQALLKRIGVDGVRYEEIFIWKSTVSAGITPPSCPDGRNAFFPSTWLTTVKAGKMPCR